MKDKLYSIVFNVLYNEKLHPDQHFLYFTLLICYVIYQRILNWYQQNCYIRKSLLMFYKHRTSSGTRKKKPGPINLFVMSKFITTRFSAFGTVDAQHKFVCSPVVIMRRWPLKSDAPSEHAVLCELWQQLLTIMTTTTCLSNTMADNGCVRHGRHSNMRVVRKVIMVYTISIHFSDNYRN